MKRDGLLRVKCLAAALSTALLAVSMAPAIAVAGGVRMSEKRTTVKARILAHIPTSIHATIGKNYDTYLVELEPEGKSKNWRLAKLSYRRFFQDPAMPSSFLNYQLLHRMRVLRDPDCDTTWGAMTMRYDQATRTDGAIAAKVVWAENAPERRPRLEAAIPCYVTSPSDYRSNKPTQGFAELVVEDHGN